MGFPHSQYKCKQLCEGVENDIEKISSTKLVAHYILQGLVLVYDISDVSSFNNMTYWMQEFHYVHELYNI